MLPGLALISVLVAVNVLGDTLRDALDPRLTATLRSGNLPKPCGQALRSAP